MILKACLILSLVVQMLFLTKDIPAQQQKLRSDYPETDQTSDTNKTSVPNFRSDGCTMWFNADYLDCCVRHDLAYWNNTSNWRMRLRADNQLFLCVAGKRGSWHLLVAPVMWSGVRIFGSDLLPISNKNIIHKFSGRIFRNLKSE